MNFGCWNVQGLTKKIQEIPFELKKLNISVAVLPETNRQGKGDEHLEDFIHFWSGVNKGNRAKAGVSIVINKKYKKCITNWNFSNERIVSVELNVFGRRMSIVDVYAPTNSYPEKAKDQFWETLKDVLDKISSASEIFLMGDFNARVKKEDDQIVGRFGEEEINNNGERLKEVCDYNLKISNIFLNIVMYINIHE
jgi:exonuclease III